MYSKILKSSTNSSWNVFDQSQCLIEKAPPIMYEDWDWGVWLLHESYQEVWSYTEQYRFSFYQFNVN